MYGIVDESGRILSPQEIKLMSKTIEGREKLKKYLTMAKVAMATQEILDYLGVELHIFSRNMTSEEMQNTCMILWNILFESTPGELSSYIKDIVDKYEDFNFDEKIGNA